MKHKKYNCRTCGNPGHNAARCPEAAALRVKHGQATDDDLVVVVTRILLKEEGGCIAHALHEGMGYLRVYPRNGVDPRAHLGIPFGEIPFFKSLPQVATYIREQQEKDGHGPLHHRPTLLSLVGAKQAFPEALFGEPHLEYAA